MRTILKEPHPSGFEGLKITVKDKDKTEVWSVRDFGGEKWRATYDVRPQLKEIYKDTYQGWEALSDSGEIIRGTKEEILKKILQD